MKVTIFDEQKDLKISQSQVSALVHEILSFKQESCEEVIVNFVGMARIQQLHQQLFDDPSPTDCISVPIDEPDDPDRILGECFICPKAAIDYDQANPYSEVTLYIAHCLLHLMGYDDIMESDRAIMRQEENKILAHLKQKNLILTHD